MTGSTFQSKGRDCAPGWKARLPDLSDRPLL